jgi:hypothetical protein
MLPPPLLHIYDAYRTTFRLMVTKLPASVASGLAKSIVMQAETEVGRTDGLRHRAEPDARRIYDAWQRVKVLAAEVMDGWPSFLAFRPIDVGATKPHRGRLKCESNRPMMAPSLITFVSARFALPTPWTPPRSATGGRNAASPDALCRCPECSGWHIGSETKKRHIAAKPPQWSCKENDDE